MKNVELLYAVCNEIRPILNRLVLVGGCATELLVTDKAAPLPRPTQDVDMVVEVVNLADYYHLENQLRSLEFTQAADDHGVICRWTKGFMKLDLMPTDRAILGFSNSWYPKVVSHALQTDLRDISLKHISAALFIATKLEAFTHRGNNDFRMSHDIEDLVAVVDGRESIVEDIATAPQTVKAFLCDEFKRYLSIEDFEDALPCHLPPDPASQFRLDILLTRIHAIVDLEKV